MSPSKRLRRRDSDLMKSLRTMVFRRDGYKCLQCGTSGNLTLDHIVPLSRGGATSYKNLRTLCSECNQSRTPGYKLGRNRTSKPERCKYILRYAVKLYHMATDDGMPERE